MNSLKYTLSPFPDSKSFAFFRAKYTDSHLHIDAMETNKSTRITMETTKD